MQIEELLQAIAKDPLCVLMEPVGQPTLEHGEVRLPPDLERFYSLCGGADLFKEREFGFRIVSPQEFRPASRQILPEDYKARRGVYDSDISAHWYLIMTSYGGLEHIVIDLDLERVGLCYDGYINTYASSECYVISDSFTHALKGVLEGRGTGESLFWQGKPEGRQYVYEMLGLEPPNA